MKARANYHNQMGVGNFLTALVATAFCLQTLGVDGYAPDMPCKDFVAMLTKAQMSGIKDCAKTMKIKDGKEKALKMNCIIKCVLVKEGLLNSEGLYTQEAYEKAKERLPGNLADREHILRKCGEDSVGVVDPKEELCKTYASMVSCLLGAIGKICKD